EQQVVLRHGSSSKRLFGHLARSPAAYPGGHSCDHMALPRRQANHLKHRAQKASAMSEVQSATVKPTSSGEPGPTAGAPSEVQSGLEGVVAFATQIAEPDKAGGALRYRGVDTEDLVGEVPCEQVRGLLVAGRHQPALPPAAPHR